MQLDRTRIAVRERSAVEILDMALHVVRAYFRPFWQATLIGVLPFALLNLVLTWGLWVDPDEGFPWRYLWDMTLLIFLEAHWATSVLTTYLGAAVFDESINVRTALRETNKRMLALIWTQGILRGTIPAIVCVALARRNPFFDGFYEGLLLTLIMLWVICLRAFRPFINEIILLERNPLRARSPNAITAGKRSKFLHDPSGGDLVLRWMGSSIVAVLLVFSFTQTLAVTIGVVTGQWDWNWVMLSVGYPLVLWMAAGYMAVVRFLNYLDLRIRHEGWEVELRLRAEYVRLESKLT